MIEQRSGERWLAIWFIFLIKSLRFFCGRRRSWIDVVQFIFNVKLSDLCGGASLSLHYK